MLELKKVTVKGESDTAHICLPCSWCWPHACLPNICWPGYCTICTIT